MYERRIYERTTGAAAAFVNGTSDDIIDVGQFSVQHCGQLFCSEDQRGCGISELKAALKGKICAFTGNSGVGKSSILNTMLPGLSLQKTCPAAAIL